VEEKKDEVFLMTIKSLKDPGSPGFSLIELMVILALAAILSAIAIPTLSSAMRDMQLASDARSISSALNVARVKATTLMTPYRIQFDLDENKWSLQKYDSSANSFVVELDVNRLSTGIVSSGISFGKNEGTGEVSGYPSSSSSYITFNTRGIPVDDSGQPTADNIVYLSKPDSDFAVTVSLTGRVEILRKDEQRGWMSQ
jgi:prepilin-type N-terminal cleavage/methylation domain-containing protein